MQWNNLLIMKD